MTRAFGDDDPDAAPNHVHRWFEDMGVFFAGAAALLVLGSLFLFAAVQSPSMLQWTGTPVKAVENGGIAYYSFQGQSYTLDVTSPLMQTGTVYLDPADPSTAMFSNPLTRWTDIATIGGPYAAAGLLLGVGFARRSRRRRRQDHGDDLPFGTGLDVKALSQLRDRQRDVGVHGRRPPQRRTDS